jgi:hypothetical protein
VVGAVGLILGMDLPACLTKSRVQFLCKELGIANSNVTLLQLLQEDSSILLALLQSQCVG